MIRVDEDRELPSQGQKKISKNSLSCRVKSIAFGLAVIMPMDLLCIHAPAHVIGLRPAHPLHDEPGKQPGKNLTFTNLGMGDCHSFSRRRGAMALKLGCEVVLA